MKNLILFILILLVGGALFYLASRAGFLNKAPARLEVFSTPNSQVYVNGEAVGSTPYANQALQAGSYTLRLVAEDSALSLSPYETTLELGRGDAAVVTHFFAPTSPDSFGHTLELRQEAGQETYLSVVTDPDTVNLAVDGIPHGYSPLSRLSLAPGSHALLLSSPGYQSQEIPVNTLAGSNLIVKAKLAVDTIVLNSPPVSTDSAPPLASPSATPVADLPKPYVLIEETGTGWLRVRSGPSATSEELGQVDVGSQLPYLGDTTGDGWHQVEFDSAAGWVSGRYASVIK